MVEQWIPNPRVVGSSPSRPANFESNEAKKYGKSKTKMGELGFYGCSDYGCGYRFCWTF